MGEYLGARAAARAVEPPWDIAWQRFFTAYDPLIRRLARQRTCQLADQGDRAQEIWRVILASFCLYDYRRGTFSRFSRTFDDCLRTKFAGRRHLTFAVTRR